MPISRTGFGSEGLSASPDKVPARLAEGRLVQPGVPWPEQGAVVAHGDESLESLGDALAHLVVEGALFRGEVSWRDQRKRMATPQFLDGSDPTPRPAANP